MKLSDINKKNIFETPDKYFENLPSTIQSRAVASSSKWVITDLFVMPNLKYALATFVFLAVAFIGFQNLKTDTKTTQEIDYLASISADEVHNYLLTTDFNEYEILEIAQENNIQIIETQTLKITTEILEEELELEDLEEFISFI